MIRVILFDIDGVIVRPPYYFGKELEKQGYVKAEEILNDYFVHHNTDCTEGRGNIKENITPYLKKLGWKETVEQFFQEQFDFESQFFDSDFIEIVRQLQEKNVDCYIASAQEKVRAEYFLKTLEFGTIFDGHYISCNIGYRKDKLEYWNFVLSDLQKKYKGIQPHEIAFFDDGKKNVEVGKTFSVQSFLFTDMTQFQKDMISLGLR